MKKLDLNILNGIPQDMVLNREKECELLVKDYCHSFQYLPSFRFIYDNLENDVMDAYEKYIHEQINEFRMQIKQLEDEVSKEILKKWDFDVSDWNVDKSDDIFRNSGIYFKSEYEYRSDGDREYLWLVKDNDMVLVSIKVYKSPTFDLDNSSATIGFDLYLSRKVEKEKKDA